MLSVDVTHGVDAGMFVRDYHRGARGGVLVYLHGLADHGLGFEAIALHPRLVPYRHVLPDLPGHGRSLPAPRPTPLSAVADHFARFIGGRFDERVTLVGHGLGGTLALLLAERNPHLVHALVDLDGPKTPDDCAALRPALEHPLGELGASGLAALRSVARSPRTRNSRPAAPACDGRLLHAWSRELVALAEEGALAARLGALDVPTLFVTTSRGDASRPALDRLAEAGVVVAELPDTGPAACIDRADELASILGDFLG